MSFELLILILTMTLLPSKVYSEASACSTCYTPACGVCAYTILAPKDAYMCNYHGTATRIEYYHDTCGGCSLNHPYPFICNCDTNYYGDSCQNYFKVPTATPTSVPTDQPTAVPTLIPTASPTSSPTNVPTSIPTSSPTSVPTEIPTSQPTAIPSDQPTESPTLVPSNFPSASPTSLPTYNDCPNAYDVTLTSNNQSNPKYITSNSPITLAWQSANCTSDFVDIELCYYEGNNIWKRVDSTSSLLASGSTRALNSEGMLELTLSYSKLRSYLEYKYFRFKVTDEARTYIHVFTDSFTIGKKEDDFEPDDLTVNDVIERLVPRLIGAIICFLFLIQVITSSPNRNDIIPYGLMICLAIADFWLDCEVCNHVYSEDPTFYGLLILLFLIIPIFYQCIVVIYTANTFNVSFKNKLELGFVMFLSTVQLKGLVLFPWEQPKKEYDGLPTKTLMYCTLFQVILDCPQLVIQFIYWAKYGNCLVLASIVVGTIYMSWQVVYIILLTITNKSNQQPTPIPIQTATPCQEESKTTSTTAVNVRTGIPVFKGEAI